MRDFNLTCAALLDWATDLVVVVWEHGKMRFCIQRQNGRGLLDLDNQLVRFITDLQADGTIPTWEV